MTTQYFVLTYSDQFAREFHHQGGSRPSSRQGVGIDSSPIYPADVSRQQYSYYGQQGAYGGEQAYEYQRGYQQQQPAPGTADHTMSVISSFIKPVQRSK